MGLRKGGCELLFGDGIVEDILDGGTRVPDGQWLVVGISKKVADEFLGMWARSTCGLEDGKYEVHVLIPVEFVLFGSLGFKSWFCAGCRDQGRTAKERSNNGHIQIRD